MWMLDDENWLLFDPVRGQVLKITQIAAAILQSCDGTHGFQEIAETISTQYGVPSSAVESVLEKYLKGEILKLTRGEICERTTE